MDEILARGLPAAETLRALIVSLVETTADKAQQALVFWREMNKLGRRACRRLPAGQASLSRRGSAAGA